MPFAHLLGDHSFGPEVLQALTTAFDDACRILQLKNRDDPLTEVIARKIVAIAARGECYPRALCAQAIEDFER